MEDIWQWHQTTQQEQDGMIRDKENADKALEVTGLINQIKQKKELSKKNYSKTEQRDRSHK